jgi:hypothetical protein
MHRSMGTTSHTSTGWIARGYDSRVIVTWILIWALAFGPAAVHHHRCVGVGDSPPDLLASLRKMHCDAPLLPASGGMKARLLDEPGAEGAGDRWIVRYDKTALLKDSSVELLLMLQPHQPSHGRKACDFRPRAAAGANGRCCNGDSIPRQGGVVDDLPKGLAVLFRDGVRALVVICARMTIVNSWVSDQLADGPTHGLIDR